MTFHLLLGSCVSVKQLAFKHSVRRSRRSPPQPVFSSFALLLIVCIKHCGGRLWLKHLWAHFSYSSSSFSVLGHMGLTQKNSTGRPVCGVHTSYRKPKSSFLPTDEKSSRHGGCSHSYTLTGGGDHRAVSGPQSDRMCLPKWVGSASQQKQPLSQG